MQDQRVCCVARPRLQDDVLIGWNQDGLPVTKKNIWVDLIHRADKRHPGTALDHSQQAP